MIRERLARLRSLWRLPFESRAAAWSVLAIAVAGLSAIVALGLSISFARHRCADLCGEREYAFKDYAQGGRFGTGPGVCTCIKEGVVLKLPMR